MVVVARLPAGWSLLFAVRLQRSVLDSSAGTLVGVNYNGDCGISSMG